MHMSENKIVSAATVVSKTDGPTSVFILGGAKPRGWKGLKRALRAKRQKRRREKVMSSIRPEGRTPDQLVEYICAVYGAKEMDMDSGQYQQRWRSCKAGLVQRCAPELIGESWEVKPPASHDQEELQEFLAQVNALQEKAVSVPEELFPMDFHVYQITYRTYGEIVLELEKVRGHLNVTVSGNPGKMRRVDREVRKIVEFFGVTEEDIAEQTLRYRTMVAVLSH